MATVNFSPAGETLYAFLAGEIDHDAAQSLRIQHAPAQLGRVLQLAGISCTDAGQKEE